jgi:hypothetical protein
MTKQDCSAVLREAVRKLRAKEHTMPEAGRPKYGPGLLVAALALEEWAEESEEPKGCTCAPTLIRKHSLGSHGSLTPCDVTCPVVDIRHSVSCPLSVVRPEVRDFTPQRIITRATRSQPLTVDGTCGRALSTGRPCPDHPAKPEPMSHAVADLILRQSMALLDEGTGPRSYGSLLGPDTGPQDVALILQAVDVVGQENILDRDLQDEIQSMRGEHA